MRYNQHAVRIALHEAFQPFEGVHVEVVGRLVEEEQIGLLKQQQGQPQAGLLPAAQGGCKGIGRDIGQL